MTREKKSAPLVAVWERAIRDSELPRLEKAVAQNLATYMSLDGRDAWPSVNRICRLFARGELEVVEISGRRPIEPDTLRVFIAKRRRLRQAGKSP